MPYEVGRFSDGDVELTYEVHGSGPRVLVYLHGLLLDAMANRRLADDLAARGNRVILLDLPGHGASAKPKHASVHRMDTYAHHVVHLLDEINVTKAVIGGMSLGANVTLETALLAPERVKGMVIEMPVLENATPVAALLFVPLLIASRYAAPVMRRVAGLARRVPRGRLGAFGSYLAPLLLEPEEMAAVLHGILIGPVAPTAEQRTTMAVPAMVIGHRADRLHPLTDASKLAAQLPEARLVQANSLLELRHRPHRLTEEIADFLDQLWEPSRSRQRLPA